MIYERIKMKNKNKRGRERKKYKVVQFTVSCVLIILVKRQFCLDRKAYILQVMVSY